jgi:hypothetical protein
MGKMIFFTIWTDEKKSLSKSTIRKLLDAFTVYYKYEKLSLLYSIFYVVRLSINYLNKKYIL